MGRYLMHLPEGVAQGDEFAIALPRKHVGIEHRHLIQCLLVQHLLHRQFSLSALSLNSIHHIHKDAHQQHNTSHGKPYGKSGIKVGPTQVHHLKSLGQVVHCVAIFLGHLPVYEIGVLRGHHPVLLGHHPTLQHVYTPCHIVCHGGSRNKVASKKVAAGTAKILPHGGEHGLAHVESYDGSRCRVVLELYIGHGTVAAGGKQQVHGALILLVFGACGVARYVAQREGSDRGARLTELVDCKQGVLPVQVVHNIFIVGQLLVYISIGTAVQIGTVEQRIGGIVAREFLRQSYVDSHVGCTGKARDIGKFCKDIVGRIEHTGKYPWHILYDGQRHVRGGISGLVAHGDQVVDRTLVLCQLQQHACMCHFGVVRIPFTVQIVVAHLGINAETCQPVFQCIAKLLIGILALLARKHHAHMQPGL